MCKLNTKCTILAATNPKGDYNPEEVGVSCYSLSLSHTLLFPQSLSVNVALASPLLSRFDMVLILLDAHNDEWDEVISSHIIKQASVKVGACSV